MSSKEGIASSEELRQLANEFERELKSNLLPFWITYAPNKDGGFYGEVSAEGIGDSSAVRVSLLSSRILWTFSSAYPSYKDESYLALAQLAFKDLETTFWDNANGGVCWSVTGHGQRNEPHKHIYAQAFAIYGYSEYFRATGNTKALEKAKSLYFLVEKHARDHEFGGYVEWLSEEWQELPPGINYLGVTTAKSQNTHLHLLEGYTNLLRVWPDAGLKQQLKNLTEIILSKILNEESHVVLYMNADWTAEGEKISFGQDIEAAWLLVETAKVLQDTNLIGQTRQLVVKIADTTIAEGVDIDGGIYMEASASQGVTKADKDWWTQAEALVGFTNAYEITGHSKYLDAVQRSWGFIKDHLISQKGEWHMTLVTSTLPVEKAVPTISSWKCPYHNARSMMETSRRLQALASAKELD